jgi:hypothetical protein
MPGISARPGGSSQTKVYIECQNACKGRDVSCWRMSVYEYVHSSGDTIDIDGTRIRIENIDTGPRHAELRQAVAYALHDFRAARLGKYLKSIREVDG